MKLWKIASEYIYTAASAIYVLDVIINFLINMKNKLMYTPEEREEDYIQQEIERTRQLRLNTLQVQVGGDHYKHGIQPWEYIASHKLNYWEGNVIKYVTRHQKKDKLQDLEKAKHYLEHMIANYKELYGQD